jgi:hypothetical protein
MELADWTAEKPPAANTAYDSTPHKNATIAEQLRQFWNKK